MHSVSKGEGVEIRVRRSMYKGRDIIDARLFYVPKGQGEFVPTGKGFAFDVSKARSFIEAMEAELLCDPTPEVPDA